MIDSYKRSIEYARISLLSNCNLQCKYCFSEEFKSTRLATGDVYKILRGLKKLNFKKVRFTGGEPLMHPDIIEILEYAVLNFRDVGITTNGTLLDKYLDKLKVLGLKRINISIDSLNKDEFKNLTKYDEFDNLLENILLAKKMGFIVKLNIVLIKELQNNFIKFIKFGKENDIQVRFIELMKIGNNKTFVNDNYISSKDILNDLDVEKLEKKKSDVCDYYLFDGYEFGIISPISNHFCDRCNRIRITSNYKLRLCLHAKNDFDFKDYLDEFDKFVLEKIEQKQEKHLLNEDESIDKQMVEIGG
ncbi:MAG: GTP 3',8-cyclase MoaA [Bacilli bacterium]